MKTLLLSSLLFGCAFILILPAQAQVADPTVTIDRYSVRFAGAGGSELLRVRVVTPDGEEVFHSGSR